MVFFVVSEPNLQNEFKWIYKCTVITIIPSTILSSLLLFVLYFSIIHHTKQLLLSSCTLHLSRKNEKIRVGV